MSSFHQFLPSHQPGAESVKWRVWAASCSFHKLPDYCGARARVPARFFVSRLPVTIHVGTEKQSRRLFAATRKPLLDDGQGSDPPKSLRRSGIRSAEELEDCNEIQQFALVSPALDDALVHEKVPEFCMDFPSAENGFRELLPGLASRIAALEPPSWSQTLNRAFTRCLLLTLAVDVLWDGSDERLDDDEPELRNTNKVHGVFAVLRSLL